jgi:hypothetical protein
MGITEIVISSTPVLVPDHKEERYCIIHPLFGPSAKLVHLSTHYESRSNPSCQKDASRRAIKADSLDKDPKV